MASLTPVNFADVMEAIRQSAKPVQILWQTADMIAFVARGREHRSEFHIDPSDEVMYMIRGDMALYYLTPDGHEHVTTIREGEMIHCPGGTPHTPRFAPDAFVLVLERKRRLDEQDRFLWRCEQCQASLYQTTRHVADYRDDPVSRVYDEFYSSEAHRICQNCGHVMPLPATRTSRLLREER